MDGSAVREMVATLLAPVLAGRTAGVEAVPADQVPLVIREMLSAALERRHPLLAAAVRAGELDAERLLVAQTALAHVAVDGMLPHELERHLADHLHLHLHLPVAELARAAAIHLVGAASPGCSAEPDGTDSKDPSPAEVRRAITPRAGTEGGPGNEAAASPDACVAAAGLTERDLVARCGAGLRSTVSPSGLTTDLHPNAASLLPAGGRAENAAGAFGPRVALRRAPVVGSPRLVPLGRAPPEVRVDLPTASADGAAPAVRCSRGLRDEPACQRPRPLAQRGHVGEHVAEVVVERGVRHAAAPRRLSRRGHRRPRRASGRGRGG